MKTPSADKASMSQAEDVSSRPFIPEQIAEVDPDSGLIIGAVDRERAHLDGTWHASTHVWIMDEEGRLLFQQRAHWINLYPNYWDISAAGHLKAGEHDGLREVAEELGLEPDIDKISFLGTVRASQDIGIYRNREYPRIYFWPSSVRLKDISFPDGEAQAIAALELSQIPRFLSGKEIVVPVLRSGIISDEVISGVDLVPHGVDYWTLLQEIVRW